MQKDFHYYATAVLALAAGFGEEDALTIAYAAQYVDDATDGRTIIVNGQPFEPKFTANNIGRYVRSYDPEVWQKVYIPFHFLPPQPLAQSSGSFITTPGSPLARQVLDAASVDCTSLQGRIRLGVALHTFADTWAHQGFSGRMHPENRVLKLEKLDECPFWDRIANAIDELMDLKASLGQWLSSFTMGSSRGVGHMQAGFLADLPYASWWAELGPDPAGQGSRPRNVRRNNQAVFLHAAKAIYDHLAPLTKNDPFQPLTWPQIEGDLKTCLAFADLDPDDRAPIWQETFAKQFPDIGLREYDSQAWERQALGEALDVSWVDDPDSTRDVAVYKNRRGFASSPWALFHQAASEQRRLVTSLFQIWWP
ncbi:MAG: DUF6765 family protein [Pseudomonadota bacterium]